MTSPAQQQQQQQQQDSLTQLQAQQQQQQKATASWKSTSGMVCSQRAVVVGLGRAAPAAQQADIFHLQRS
jgi:hypothetical protein